mmetsp:Transcript_24946/g.63267  ORF Transcript_24946/g.63267 Transcript_24946/m.63267 type:complete len:190 (-) Transcript_24946:20-589(-)
MDSEVTATPASPASARSRSTPAAIVDVGYGGLRHSAGGCLNAQAPHTQASALETWSCVTGYDNQEWYFDVGRGQLRNRYGLCVDAKEPDTARGKVHLWTCYDQPPHSQEWFMVSDWRQGVLMNWRDYCLAAELPRDGIADGMSIFVLPCDKSDQRQIWETSALPTVAPTTSARPTAAPTTSARGLTAAG